MSARSKFYFCFPTYWSAEQTVAPTGTDQASGVLTARNLQEVLTKLTVDDQNKSHEFWDTQPVPKLGTYTSVHMYST